MTADRNWSEEDQPFELLRELGAGGFARTHMARILDEDFIQEWGTEVVALKIPLDKKKERVLQKEVENNAVLHMRLRDLQAANLVRYLGFCVFQGRLVMAMQYVAGGSLRGRMGSIGRQKCLPPEEAAEIAEGVLAGLAAIHREHIFHRDIKPENILMDGSIPKIADLGISRMLQSDELASTTTGTLFYMSPELLFQDGASFPSDIWSMGVTLYEMVTGHLPFGGMGAPMGRVIELIRRGQFIPPREHVPDIPEELERIILKSLAREVSDRYGSAEEMIRDLRLWREGKGSGVIAELEEARELVSSMEPAPEAEAKLKGLLGQYPDEPRAYQYLGEYFNRCQRYGDAIATFEEGLRHDPEYALLHWDLALAHQRTGQKRKAAAALEKAVDLGLDASLQRHAALLLKALKGG